MRTLPTREPRLREAGRGMTPTCQRLERYWFGSVALTEACANPGTWIPVYQVRPLEWAAYALGIPFRPLLPVLAVIYDREDRGYYALRAEPVFGPDILVLRGPTPVHRLWSHCPTFDAWLYRGSDIIERAFAAALRPVGVFLGFSDGEQRSASRT